MSAAPAERAPVGEVAVSAPPDPIAAPRAGYFAGRSLIGLVAVAGAGVGFGLLLALVRLHWSPLAALDRDVASGLNRRVSQHGWMVTVLKQVSVFGGRPFFLWLVVVAMLWLLIRRRYRLALYLAVTGAGALVLDPSLKVIVGRLRPVVEAPVAHAPGNSFPSGHALGSMVAYGALVLVFLPALRPGRRWLLVVPAGVLVFAIGVSRVGLGVHFVSDVLGGWLLGAAWLGVTGYAFRLWRREVGRGPAPLGEGLEPEQAPALAPAPAEHQLLAHPWSSAFELVTGWVLIFGAVYAFGVLVSKHVQGSVVARWDSGVPRWLAEHRSTGLNGVSWWASKAGDTHAILLIALVFCPLALAAIRRWRPLLFVALVMFGELSLFLASAAAVGRDRPDVSHLDGQLPTSSFPSGHVAATTCLWWAMVLLVLPRTRAWWRWILVALAVLMPALVAVSRMYRGMHHPTDVAGAVILASLLLVLVYFVVRPNADLRQPPPARPATGSSTEPAQPPSTRRAEPPAPRPAESPAAQSTESPATQPMQSAGAQRTESAAAQSS